MQFKSQDIVKLHGFEIGLDRNALPLPILRAILKGWYEGGEVRLIDAFVSPSDRVIELGSGIGLTTMAVAKIVGSNSVFPYELNPYLIDWSSFNFSRNGLEIEAQQFALLPQSMIDGDTIDFHIHKNFWGSSLLAREGTIETIAVPTLALEQAIAQHSANTLLIDIEGAETDLLMQTKLDSIEKIIMEIHYGIAGRQKTDDMIRHLVLNGFSIDLHISNGSVVALYRDGLLGL